ncbi:hypothetical protein Tco_0937084 [Tanacetum coccineum]|uniref:Uncharacterized protein n=1 Tax=Tanacetum coccineum TaxID=301880 RepID=A0ABQ5DDY6_9ASTR
MGEAMQEELCNSKLPTGLCILEIPPLSSSYTDSDYDGATQERKSTTGGLPDVESFTSEVLFEGRLLMSICSLSMVGDEAVHKELGNIMERAATTASSLEAEQDSEQFWQTAALSITGDGVRGITATIDRKVKVFVSEASIRRHLNLEDSDGISSLPAAKNFEQLALIGYAITSDSLTFQKVDIPLFPTMLTTPESSPSRITSSPSLSPQTHPSTSQPPSTLQSNQTTPVTEEAALMPHEFNSLNVHSLGRDEGSLSLNELMNLCTSLSEKVESLESELKQTKQTYHAALTKLIKWVKKLEQTIKISQARRRAKFVIFDAEEDKEDPSKQGRSLIEELDLDAGISLVPPYAADQGRIDDTQITRRRNSVENVQTYTRRSRLVSTADVSTASELGSTAGVKAKDKGKAIMQESEPPKKIKKRVQVQMSVDEELAKKVFEEEQAKFKAQHQQEKSDFETALELQKQLDEREEVVAQAHNIDWSDPAVLRYHTLQNRPFSVAEVRKNMCMYLKNQGGYKLSHFKGMSYEDIRPIFERVWDQNQAFVPKDSEIEKEVMKRSGFDLQQEFVKKDEASSFVQKQPARGKARNDPLRKKNFSLLTLFPEDESLNIESLTTKYPIVDWETQVLANDKYYYQIKIANGSVKHYKIFSAMLYDFDRQDVLELYRLVKERFQTASPKGYDLLLWGDLKTMIEPNEEDKIWRNQQDWNLINWKLHNFCGVHMLLMDTGFVIHMMVEKKYPLSQDTLSKMLSKRLEVDHQSEMGYELIRLVKSQFWTSANVKTVNRERQIQALVDKKKVIISKTSIRSDLKLDDAEGTDCRPIATIFAELERIVFLDKQVEGMSKHKGVYVTPSHTKKVFANMKRPCKGFSRRVTPLFSTMMVQATEDMGADSATPTDSHSTPIITQPSSSKPQKKKSRRKQRKDSAPTEPTTEETTPKEHVSTSSYDPPPSGEDRMQLAKLISLCTNLQEKVLDLEKAKTAQAKEITSLKKRVKQSTGTQEMNDDNLMFDTSVLEEQEIKFEKVVEEPVVSVATSTKSIPVRTAEVVTTRPSSQELKIPEN